MISGKNCKTRSFEAALLTDLTKWLEIRISTKRISSWWLSGLIELLSKTRNGENWEVTAMLNRWSSLRMIWKTHWEGIQLSCHKDLTNTASCRLEKILVDSAKDYFEQKRDRAKKSAEVLKKLSPQQSILGELKIAFMGEALRDLQCALKYAADENACSWLSAGSSPLVRSIRYFVSAYQSVCKLESEAKQHEELITIAEFLNIKVLIPDDDVRSLSMLTTRLVMYDFAGVTFGRWLRAELATIWVSHSPLQAHCVALGYAESVRPAILPFFDSCA